MGRQRLVVQTSIEERCEASRNLSSLRASYGYVAERLARVRPCWGLAGCSLGGGSAASSSGQNGVIGLLYSDAPATVTPDAHAVMLVSRIPLRFTRTPLKSVVCHATGYQGRANCTGQTTVGGMGTTGEVTIDLRLTGANRPVPTCTPGHGPSPDPTLFCVS
jgi:hypothetical protein